MIPANLNIENSAVGEQYAIAGTERKIKLQRLEYMADSSDHFET